MLSCDVIKVTTARKSTFAKLHLFLSLCNAVHYIYLQRRGRKNKTQNKTISLFTNVESEKSSSNSQSGFFMYIFAKTFIAIIGGLEI